MGKYNIRIAFACLAVAVGGVGLLTSAASSQPTPQAVPAVLPLGDTPEEAVVKWGQAWDYRAGSTSESEAEHFSSLWVDTEKWQSGQAPFGWGDIEYRTAMPAPAQSVSTYFRTEFQLPDLASLESAVVKTMADDGIVLYVNGVEIGRENMNAGPITARTFADTSVETHLEWEIPHNVLRWGRNVISAEVHANSYSTRAISFDAEVEATFQRAPAADRPLHTGATWQYALQNEQPHGDWNTSSEAVAHWAAGAAPLGWGSHSVTTEVKSERGYGVLYARSEFEVAGLDSVASAYVTTVADDGVLIRINGVEVGRANLPEGELKPTSSATHSYFGTAKFEIPVSELTDGTNIITAEVRKAHSVSPTVLFDAQIDLLRKGSPSLAEDQVEADADGKDEPDSPVDGVKPGAGAGADQPGRPSPGEGDAVGGAPVTPDEDEAGQIKPEPAKPNQGNPDPAPPAAGNEQAVGAIPGWGEPSWQDEFNGSSVNESKWRVRDGDYLAYDQAAIREENVTVKNGNLVIKTDSLPNKVVFSDGRERWWSTGYVDTVGRSSQKYGRWEFRAKLPISPGESRAIWPAIWLRDSNGPGEIDLMEAFGGPHDKLAAEPDGAWGITVHESSASNSKGKRLKHSEMRRGQEHIGESWHTWALEWTPKGMDFFFDGEKIWSASAADHPWLNTAFSDQGVDIRLNTQVGHSWGGYADPAKPHETKVPVDFLIDYVRVWEYKP